MQLLAMVLATGFAVSAAEPAVVAVTDVGVVTTADVDREVAFMATREKRYREEMHITPEQTRRDVIERIALRKIALAVAAVDGTGQEPLVVERIREARRQWMIAQWRRRVMDVVQRDLPSEEEVRRKLAGSVPAPPDRIKLSHIYLPAPDEAKRSDAEHRMEDWRRLNPDLDAFRRLATQHSASQDHDRGGRLGWLHRGFLDPDLERVLYGLESGSVSPPLYFDGGMHLFYVEEVDVDRSPRIEATVQAELERLGVEAFERRKSEHLAVAREHFPVNVKATSQAVWPTVTVGNYTVSGSVLERIAGPQAEVEPWIEQWIESELLFQSAREAPWAAGEIAARLGDIQGQILHEIAATRWVSEEFEQPSAGQIEALIASEPEHFRLRFRMQARTAVIRLDGSESPRRLAAEMKMMAEAVSEGRQSWDEGLAGLPPGVVTKDFALATDLELAGALGPQVFKVMAKVEPGSVVGPVQSEGKLWLVEVVDRRPPGPMPAADAAARAAKILRSRTAAALGHSFGDRRLKDHGFRIIEGGQTNTDKVEGS